MKKFLIPALVLIAIIATPVLGASLQSWDLIIDGSHKPAGDRFDVTVFLEPNERDITLKIRAFWISINDKTNQNPRPFNSRGKSADAKGNHLIQYQWNRENCALVRDLRNPRIKRRPNLKEVCKLTGSLVVPFASLETKIPDKISSMGYVLQGITKINNEIEVEAFLQPSELHPMKITAGGITGTRPFPTKKTISSAPLKMIPVLTKAYSWKEGDEKPTIKEIKVYQHDPDDFGIGVRPQPQDMTDITVPGTFERAAGQTIDGKSKTPWKPKQEEFIAFATNRNYDSSKKKIEEKFGTKIVNGVRYGFCKVNIPLKTHKAGELKTGSWWFQDPNKDKVFFILKNSLKMLPRRDFFPAFSKKDVLLYIHGYRNTFEDAILAGAQIQHDIQFPGQALVFSWASQGTLRGYLTDRKHAKESWNELQALLIRLMEYREEGRDVHIVAHSMGNYVLVHALQMFQKYAKDKHPEWVNKEHPLYKEPPFKSITFAAPDVHANAFGSYVNTATKLSSQTTFYYSSEDFALKRSSEIHEQLQPNHAVFLRAGLYPHFSPGLDTINADAANSVWAGGGHNYLSGSDSVLWDLRLITKHGLKPTSRKPPVAGPEDLVDFEGLKHWFFLPPGSMAGYHTRGGDPYGDHP